MLALTGCGASISIPPPDGVPTAAGQPTLQPPPKPTPTLVDAPGTATDDGASDPRNHTDPSDDQSGTGGDQLSGPPATTAFTAVWANEGGDKVTREELRATNGADVMNSVWNGTTISLFGAKNEVVNFNLILEAATTAVADVSVTFTTLTGPGGAKIASVPATGDALFSWVDRPIELFYVRYLPINGLSKPAYENYYDERHVPKRLRRPWTGNGAAKPGTTWSDRPDHNTYYPDIAVPLELTSPFTVAAGRNQGIWADIYIPTSTPAGLYTGMVTINEAGAVTRQIPVQLTVRNFALPDRPSAKTMVFLGYQDLNTRYLASKQPWPWEPADLARSELLRNRHFLLAHRHRLSLIDADYGNLSAGDAPRPEWLPRLTGSLFTAAQGYAGPGVDVGNAIYSIGTYGQFVTGWLSQGASAIHAHSNNWVNWFAANAPTADYFLYLIDESSDFASIETWASTINANPGSGKNLLSMATLPILDAVAYTPSLDIPTSPAMVGLTTVWQDVVGHYLAQPDKRVYYYNSRRPISGSFAIEDDGVALRELAWGQYKKKIDRWLYWESTYYNNYQGGMGQTNVFQKAQTFGTLSTIDTVQGETGWMYGNGDGVLFYPGTDYEFPAESYGLNGPMASLRLKYWRRGIQDVDYLTMAAAINPTAVQTIVNQMVPKALWEVGVDTPSDPTYVHADISWAIDPDVWETARKQLADIIEYGY